MVQIDWEALRSAVVENEKKDCKETQKTESECLSDFFVEINGLPIGIEIQKKDIPENVFAMRRRLLAYYKYFQCSNYKMEAVKELYKTIFDFLQEDFHHLCGSMKEDINELDICYSSGAYKATLILAGSILEAFLLDWLSEIDGKNYFEEPYKIKVFREDGTYKWEKREQLNVYIDQIKEIERPDWMEPSEKAHFIRESRNSVHAKVCLKKEIGINQDTCEKVINYLKDIVESRLDKRRKELGIY